MKQTEAVGDVGTRTAVPRATAAAVGDVGTKTGVTTGEGVSASESNRGAKTPVAGRRGPVDEGLTGPAKAEGTGEGRACPTASGGEGEGDGGEGEWKPGGKAGVSDTENTETQFPVSEKRRQSKE
jgi:hypothetical protein